MGLPVDCVSVEDIHAFMQDVISKKAKALVLNVNIHCVVLALKNPWLFEFLKKAELIFCDGDGVRWGLQLLGRQPPPKVTYDRWIWQLAEWCEGRGYRLFFLGAKPGVAREAAERLKARYPGLQIAGAEHGHFRHEGPENEEMIARIQAARADILILGFGMPLQEKWLAQNAARVDVRIFLTGGAVFDYAAGRARRAPEWMIKSHLEWLYRVIREPRRLFMRYALEIPYFFYKILQTRICKGK